MMVWDVMNVLGRILLTLIVTVKITRFRVTLNVWERVGLGLMGAGGFLTVNVIWEQRASPFDGWASVLMTYGAVMFLAGRTWRDWNHEWRNSRTIRDAQRHLVAKGKL